MKFPDSIEEAIKAGKFNTVYSYLYTLLLADPGFNTRKFFEALEEIKRRNITGFFQKYDNTPFLPEEQWDKEYWDILSSELMDNFCLERIAVLQKVGAALSQKKSDGTANPTVQDQDRQIVPKRIIAKKWLVTGGIIILILLLILVVILLTR